MSADTVTLTRAEYEALLRRVEDAEDRAALARSGQGVYLPAELADRLIAGESPIRIFRELRGLTLEELAERSGVKLGLLHRLDTGEGIPSLPTLRRLARALGVDLDDLVD
jgi:mRNA interferase RelE/StbE